MQNKKVYLFPKYDANGPSSRYRTYQYIKYQRRKRRKYEIYPLLSLKYLTALWGNLILRKHVIFLYSVIRRIFTVLSLPPSSTVYVEYELIPYFPDFFERLLVRRGCNLIVDYDDAIFHNYDCHRYALIRRALGSKIANVMSYSSVVISGNAYISSYARNANAKKILQLPTVIDVSLYSLKTCQIESQICIGWIGTPITSHYLSMIEPVLERLSTCFQFTISLIGLKENPFKNIHSRVRIIQWSQSTEAADIKNFDIGIMPLTDDPWSRGKCGLKLLQYMATGIPVVASPVGANCEIVKHGESGFLARTELDWVSSLTSLFTSADLRYSMGKRGRERVAREFSLEAAKSRYLNTLFET